MGRRKEVNGKANLVRASVNVRVRSIQWDPSVLAGHPASEDKNSHRELYSSHSPEKTWGKAMGRFLELYCTDFCNWAGQPTW